MLVALPVLLVVALVGGVVHHVHLTATHWLAFLLGTWLGSVPFAALGILLGYLRDSQSAQTGTGIVYLDLSLPGGLWFPAQEMPHVMRDIAHWLPSYHLASLGWNVVEGQGLGYGNLEVLAASTVLFGIVAMRRYRRGEARERA